MGIGMSRLKYMVVERFRYGDAAPVWQRFRERGQIVPEGLTYISSWVISSDDSRPPTRRGLP